MQISFGFDKIREFRISLLACSYFRFIYWLNEIQLLLLGGFELLVVALSSHNLYSWYYACTNVYGYEGNNYSKNT